MESLKLSIMNRTHRRLLVKVWPNCNREPRILEISVLPGTTKLWKGPTQDKPCATEGRAKEVSDSSPSEEPRKL